MSKIDVNLNVPQLYYSMSQYSHKRNRVKCFVKVQNALKMLLITNDCIKETDLTLVAYCGHVIKIFIDCMK